MVIMACAQMLLCLAVAGLKLCFNSVLSYKFSFHKSGKWHAVGPRLPAARHRLGVADPQLCSSCTCFVHVVLLVCWSKSVVQLTLTTKLRCCMDLLGVQLAKSVCLRNLT